MFDDDGRLVAYTGRYRDKVIELKTRSVTMVGHVFVSVS